MYVNFVLKRPSLLCVNVDIATRCSRLALTFIDCAPTHRSQQGGTDGELWGDGGIKGGVWGVTETDVDVWAIGYDCNRNQYMYTCMLIGWMCVKMISTLCFLWQFRCIVITCYSTICFHSQWNCHYAAAAFHNHSTLSLTPMEKLKYCPIAENKSIPMKLLIQLLKYTSSYRNYPRNKALKCDGLMPEHF